MSTVHQYIQNIIIQEKYIEKVSAYLLEKVHAQGEYISLFCKFIQYKCT